MPAHLCSPGQNPEGCKTVVVVDSVPREVIRWAMLKLGVEEWLVSAVICMYSGAKTVVRTVYGSSYGFEVRLNYPSINPWYSAV